MRLFSLLADGFDLPVLDWIAEHLWCPFLDGVMPAITVLGDAGIFWMVMAAVLLLWLYDRKRTAINGRFRALSPALRLAVIGGLGLVILVFGMYGIGFNAEAFIYSKF